MRLLSGFLWFLYKIVVLYTFAVYALTYWTLSSHWGAGFMMLTLPFLLALHLLFLLFWLLIAPKRVVAPILVLAAGYPFLSRTFQLNTTDEKSYGQPLKVMNYNVLRFHMNEFKSGENTFSTEDIRAWLSEQDADIICFQEFYHYAPNPKLNFASLLRKAGYRYHTSQSLNKRASDAYELGVAIYSRFPIVAKQDTFFGGQNGLLQADILWKQDTIRIIDVHLYSMTLKLDKLAQQKEYEGLKRETKGTFRQMRKGYINRAEELAVLEGWIKNTPASHPIIVCGDFNETPYSYVYGRMSNLLTNAFEVKGQGFGFTFNQLPYFIRIDHQFFNQDQLELHDFKVLKDIPYSDHYPVVGNYSLR